jgi:hypothetical protein
MAQLIKESTGLEPSSATDLLITEKKPSDLPRVSISGLL